MKVLWKAWSSREVAGLLIIIIIISITKLGRASQKGNATWLRGVGRKEKFKESFVFGGGWGFCTSFFLGKKKPLNNQNTQKRKEQRVTLLQVIIYYRNSSTAQLF